VREREKGEIVFFRREKGKWNTLSFSLSIQVGRIQKKKTIVKEMTTLANFKGKLYSFVIL
jgi:hypothetical protein